MVAYISGIGTLIDFIVCSVIAIRLYKPTKETGFSFQNFRGSLFWMFVSLTAFMFFMTTNLITDDVQIAGYGYVIGHIFLYLGLAIYMYSPFAMIKPDNKIIPSVLALIIAVSGMIITYINWVAYATKETLPVYEDGVTIWNPPEIVFIYIGIVVIVSWVLLGTAIFWYHARKTTNPKLRRRSFFIGLGLLFAALGGPLHDAPLPGATILIADIVTAIGFILVAVGILSRVN